MPRLRTSLMDTGPTFPSSGTALPPEQLPSAAAGLAPSSLSGVVDPLAERPPATRRSNRTRRPDVQATPIPGSPMAPLVRPDGTPAAVVHLVPELSPYARTGGLGEAVSSLAKYQAASGIPVTVFMPLYTAVRERTEIQPIGPAFAVTVGPRTETARLYEPSMPHQQGYPKIVFVESAEYFDRPGLYGDDAGDYPDNARRYALFARAVLVSLPRVLPQAPSIVHAHDWQTALASVYLKTEFTAHP